MSREPPVESRPSPVASAHPLAGSRFRSTALARATCLEGSGSLHRTLEQGAGPTVAARRCSLSARAALHAPKRTWLLPLVLAFALLATAGCDRFQSADSSPPRLVAIFLADPSGSLPAREVVPSGEDVRITDVPVNLSRLRIRFNKPVDGATIQLSPNPVSNGTEPAGNVLPFGCAPAANVEVTQAGGSGAASFTASVCYDPSGPDMVVDPAAATCAGPVPASAYRSAVASSTAGAFPALERGATYTIRATGVKDQQGRAISFAVTLVASTGLGLASDPADPTFQAVLVASEYGADGSVTGYAALDPASTMAGVPAGPPSDPSTGAPPSVVVNEKTGFTAFGPDILVRFDAPLCSPRGDASDLPDLPGYCAPMGVDTGSLPGVKLLVAGQEVTTLADPQATALHLPFSGGYDTVSDAYVAGDLDAVHVIPWLPLEDGQTYTLILDGGVTDVTGASFATPEQLSFQAAPGDFRVQIVQPPNGASGALPTTDLLHAASASTGHGIEFVVSRPLALGAMGRPLGTIELHEGDATGPLAQFAGQPLSADVAALDSRGRWFAIGARAGQGDLALKSGQRYTVVLDGLVSAADPGARVGTLSWSFTTAPFSRDPALSVPLVESAITGADPVPGAGGAVTGPFLVQYVTGKVRYDTSAAPAVAPQAGGEQLFPLLGAGATAPSLALAKVKDASGAPCTAGCEVAGISGYVKTTSGLDLFANGARDDPNPNLRSADLAAGKPRAGLPLSALGFLPSAPLEPGAAYQLTLTGVVAVDGTPLAAPDANGRLALPFTISPFTVRRVLSQAALDAGDRGQALTSGARFVAVDAAHPITVELQGSPDLPASGTATSGDLTNDPIALVDSQTGKGVPIAMAPATTSALRVTLAPLTALAASRTHTLLVTSKLRPRGQPAGSGGAAPFSLSFTTPDRSDGSGNLACEQ